MKVGHIYKKGESYYLYLLDYYYEDDYYTQFIDMGDMHTVNFNTDTELDESEYTHIGKAIELIKRGKENG